VENYVESVEIPNFAVNKNIFAVQSGCWPL